MVETMAPNERKIYDCLSDEKSKKIFTVRKSFAELNTADFLAVFDGRPLRNKAELRFIMEGKSFVCYGAGDGCKIFLQLMKQYGFSQNCRAVFDSNKSLHGGLCLGGEKTVSKYSQDIVNSVDKIVITPFYYTASDEVKKHFMDLGVEEDKLVVLSEYFSVNNINVYFDTQIIAHFDNDEIFVDGGCLDFSTSRFFLKNFPNTLKIYAIEPIREQIEIIKHNIDKSGFTNVKIVNGALWSHDTKLNFLTHEVKSASKITEDSTSKKVNAYALDNIVEAEEKITFIKMDIEGAELEALKGSEKTIRRCKPKLAISIYHKPLDYIDIPQYIKSIVPEYKMFFRHYTSFDTETVLYCVNF
jgi:FkbM family methyltransferase